MKYKTYNSQGIKNNHLATLLLIILVFSYSCKQESKLKSINDLSNNEWYIWPDKEAQWIDDTLFLPPVNIDKLPVNLPTCGWEALFNNKSLPTTIPATVEEYLWNENGNYYGIAGNYKGVSWFYTYIDIPANLEGKGKRIVLDFESVRLRAEVFVEGQLVGYDLIDGTPFQVDITNAVKYGQENRLAVRITDPTGNFNWRDSRQFKWGKNSTILSHGFGGITGKVKLLITDNIYINDIYVKNKPEITDIDVELEINNITSNNEEGEVALKIYEKDNPGIVIYDTATSLTIGPGLSLQKFKISADKAKVWSLEDPSLYTLEVNWKGTSTEHNASKDFGFRWFDIVDADNNRYFELNNKRIVLRSSISWGFWPVNGIYPTQELAKKHVKDAKELGLNMLNFHRAIGNNTVFEEADKQGLLYYEEPGGYRTSHDELSKKWAQIKLYRMVRRDRSHPSLVIYNMQNEIGRDPYANDIEAIKKAHEIDDSRTITFTSTNFSKGFYNNICPDYPAGVKMHMLPNDTFLYYYGYWDQHHAGSPGVYFDQLYKSPEEYSLYTENSAEIVFYGEQGALGTVQHFPKIYKSIKETNKPGWDGEQYVKTYEAYDQFLSEKGFYNSFNSMEDLITSIGNVALYYQGRMIENIRANNIIDGYVVNGWEDEKLENHSGIVDIYRNIKGDKEILAYYNQPSYLAVKLRNKVIELGDTAVADIFIINETDIKGNYTLKIQCVDSSGIVAEKEQEVKIEGGNTYGQLIASKIKVSPKSTGYCNVNAFLVKADEKIVTGKDEIFVVKLTAGPISEPIAYCEERENSLLKLLETINLSNPKPFNKRHFDKRSGYPGLLADTVPEEKILVVSAPPPENYSRNQNAIFDWVMDGNTMIIIKYADKWAEFLNANEVVDYRGSVQIDKNWFGGNHFVKDHPLFNDLPVNCAFNWEYQSLAQYIRYRYGMRLYGEECIVGVQCEHKPELFTSVGIIPLGRGEIILSALDLEKAINSNDKAAIVAKKILQNYILYAQKKNN